MNANVNQSQALAAQRRPDQRMSRKYRFDDLDMDLFFMSALSHGPAGGLDIGQAYYIADQIVDGDAESWVRAFADYGDIQAKQADAWAGRGRNRAAGEARLKAFASYRSAWQFADAGGPVFCDLYARHRAAFVQALDEMGLPATLFEVPFKGSRLPGLFLRNANPNAPVVLVVGGADTCREDLFLAVARATWERGYSVATVDLPGQGIMPNEGLHWSTTPEQPISAVVDVLVQQFDAQPGRIGLIGLSLGGYFVTRAAMYEPRFGAVAASSPFPRPYELFELSVRAGMEAAAKGQVPTSGTVRSRKMMAWKAGAATPQDMLMTWRDAKADPTRVTVPFLSIVGAGDSVVFTSQARDWHEHLASHQKEIVFLEAATGADAHCQVNARVRLVQEATGWMDEIFGAATAR